MMEVYKLQVVDREYQIHLQAWANFAAQATKNIGTDKKPKVVSAYESFDDFYDYQKRLAEVKGEVVESEEEPVVDNYLLELINQANKGEGG